MRRWRVVAGLVAVVLVAAGVYFLRPVEGPARDLTLAADAEHGAYVMRLGGCVACHTDTANSGALLAGGAALKTDFGDFVPPNITPHPQAGIGGWSLAQFSDALSNGKGPGLLHHYYPAFPYDSYTLMSDQDVVDLYAAIMEVAPVAERASPNRVSFPFNIRAGLLAWKNLFFNPERFTPDPDRSARWNRGAYLALGPGHCAACHTPRNFLGAPDISRQFSGSQGGPGGRAPAITRARLQAEGYDVALLADALQSGFTPGFDVLGGAMAEVVAEGTSHWTQEDLEAIAAYLLDED